MVDSVIFDLDGTLWDSRQSVATARNNLSNKLGLNLPPFTVEDVQRTMGLTMDKVYQMAFSSISKEKFVEVRQSLDSEISSVVMRDGAVLFPGVEDTMSTLALRFSLFLVSNCSRPYLDAYFKWSGHGKYFKDFLCNGDNGLPKGENIRLIVANNKLKRPVYVGDTGGDHQAAIEAGVDYIHADYGFGQPAGPCRRIAAIAELKDLGRWNQDLI